MDGFACGADRSFGTGYREDSLLFGDAVRRQHVQLRLHRQPRDRQRCWRLFGPWAELAGYDTTRYQEGISLYDAIFSRCLPHPALESGRYAECREGAGRLQGAAPVGLSQTARSTPRAYDRVSKVRPGVGQEELF